ncbi:hypothetical protein GJ744_004690 [Endocarpon pusillum]|uniref:Uncharacterized protein n=1 Tax=Endocarpon pusillum TaxID=364733 RepID=A0A8H7DYT9_9EURO|nr:hypothetical protein GJ744_004690 [Endocarpon pusillum]
MPLTTHSPQPSRPLKRKLFDGALNDDENEHIRKRTYHPITSQQHSWSYSPRLSQPLKISESVSESVLDDSDD